MQLRHIILACIDRPSTAINMLLLSLFIAPNISTAFRGLFRCQVSRYATPTAKICLKPFNFSRAGDKAMNFAVSKPGFARGADMPSGASTRLC